MRRLKCSAGVKIPMRLRQRPAGEPSCDSGIEVRAFRDVLVLAPESMTDGLTSSLGPRDLLIEFRELAPRKPAPFLARASARVHQKPLLRQRETRIAVQQNRGHRARRSLGVTALSGNPGRSWKQTAFLVVAQRRGGDSRPARQLADGQQLTGLVDFKCP